MWQVSAYRWQRYCSTMNTWAARRFVVWPLESTHQNTTVRTQHTHAHVEASWESAMIASNMPSHEYIRGWRHTLPGSTEDDPAEKLSTSGPPTAAVTSSALVICCMADSNAAQTHDDPDGYSAWGMVRKYGSHSSLCSARVPANGPA